MAQARSHVHGHLLSPESWSIYNVANLARFTVERLSRESLPPTPFLDYLSAFNLGAVGRGMPPLSFSDYVAAMHQLAAVTPLAEICGSPPELLRFLELAEPTAPAMLKPLQGEAIAALFKKLCEDGFDTITPAHADPVAVVISCIEHVVRKEPSRRLELHHAYRAYLAWTAAFLATPLPRATFMQCFEALIATLAPDAFPKSVADDGAVTFKGLYV